MTPEEQAKKLLYYYLEPKLYDFDFTKKLAISAVDFILNTIYDEDFEGHLIDEKGANEYWEEVKKEIKKINGTAEIF